MLLYIFYQYFNILIAVVAISVIRLWGSIIGVLGKLLCIKWLENITVSGTH